jgi:Ca-activated chloride channel family protein
MRFIWHEALWLLLAVPILVGTYEYIVRRAAIRQPIRFTNVGLVSAATSRSQWIRRRIPPLLFLLGITGLLFAVARPAAVFLVPAQRGTVVLAMDVSLSMAATDVEPTRLAAAQAAATQFVETIPAGIRVGVLAFGAYAEMAISPTADKARVLRALTGLKLQQYTALGTGLLAALLMIHPRATVNPQYDLFSRVEDFPEAQSGFMLGPPPPRIKPKHDPTRPAIDPSTLVILVSDGKGTLGVPAHKAAEVVADYGIRVYTVGIGTPYGGVARVEGYPATHAEFEEETLELIADITQGKYFRASSLADIKSIYDDLSRDSVRERKEIEISAVSVALGGILLVLGATLSLIWHSQRGWAP